MVNLESQKCDLDVVILIGKPGSGKSTFASKISQNMPDRVCHVAIGDLVRSYCSCPYKLKNCSIQNSEDLIKKIRTGETIDDISELINYIETQKLKKFLILVDGFPRKPNQVYEFKDIIHLPAAVLNFEVSDSIARKRLQKRGRIDDNLSGINKRLGQHRDIRNLLEKEYGENIILKVNAEDHKEKVYHNLLKKLTSMRLI
ncbi:MAG: Adenylate kinase isoenzyme 1 [Paramarteilia canceri]